jgi:hypothetical protein
VLQNPTGLQAAIYKGPIFKVFSKLWSGIRFCFVFGKFAVKIKGFRVCNTVVLESSLGGNRQRVRRTNLQERISIRAMAQAAHRVGAIQREAALRGQRIPELFE